MSGYAPPTVCRPSAAQSDQHHLSPLYFSVPGCTCPTFQMAISSRARGCTASQRVFSGRRGSHTSSRPIHPTQASAAATMLALSSTVLFSGYTMGPAATHLSTRHSDLFMSADVPLKVRSTPFSPTFTALWHAGKGCRAHACAQVVHTRGPCGCASCSEPCRATSSPHPSLLFRSAPRHMITHAILDGLADLVVKEFCSPLHPPEEPTKHPHQCHGRGVVCRL